MPSVISLQEFGNQIAVLFDDGTKLLAYPTTGGLWLIKGNTIGSDDWVWPLSIPPWSWGDGYGMRFNPISGLWTMHWGVDINGSGISGTNIRAAAHGEVMRIGSSSGASYGYNISLRHDDGSGTFYAHMFSDPAGTFIVGDFVDVGDTVGQVGNTGDSTGAHLHFNTQNVYNNNPNTGAVDPVAFMAARSATMP